VKISLHSVIQVDAPLWIMLSDRAGHRILRFKHPW